MSVSSFFYHVNMFRGGKICSKMQLKKSKTLKPFHKSNKNSYSPTLNYYLSYCKVCNFESIFLCNAMQYFAMLLTPKLCEQIDIINSIHRKVRCMAFVYMCGFCILALGGLGNWARRKVVQISSLEIVTSGPKSLMGLIFRKEYQ